MNNLIGMALALSLLSATFAIIFTYGLIKFIKWSKARAIKNKATKEQKRLAKIAQEKADHDKRLADVLKFMKELFGEKK